MSTIPEMKAETLEQKLNNNEDVTVIDVREDEEVAEGMIPNAKHIKLGNLPEQYRDLDKETDYVVVCRSGRRSMKASEFLKENGFSSVTNLEGGMLAWSGDLSYK
ncbi:rhodanese-like domain-containing protein [Salimicrobium flavidum]|uniref:Rhodanese-related sulfurtransferase n=1 Tax=Salimicrobium flavidum TaxID=570947 RepID=A0A1N7J444_9BACI|nr:rhodanese-like domain-containing protein [Salimicrobium flavidum]SIS44110.1 Rhodanese-related sulfurtransferase [Salimicrobium flavidum]